MKLLTVIPVKISPSRGGGCEDGVQGKADDCKESLLRAKTAKKPAELKPDSSEAQPIQEERR